MSKFDYLTETSTFLDDEEEKEMNWFHFVCRDCPRYSVKNKWVFLNHMEYVDRMYIFNPNKSCNEDRGHRLKSFHDLLVHAISADDYANVEQLDESEVKLRFKVEKSIIQDTAGKKIQFKLIGRVKFLDRYKQEFPVALFLVTYSKPGPHNKNVTTKTSTLKFHVVPVFERDDWKCNDLIDVRIRWTSKEIDQEDVITKFNNIKCDFMWKEWLNSKQAKPFAKDKLLQFNRGSSNEKHLVFEIGVRIKAFRVRTENAGIPVYFNKYATVWKVLHLSNHVTSFLKKTCHLENDPPPFYKVMLPQFNKLGNLIVESTDDKEMFYCMAAKCFNYAWIAHTNKTQIKTTPVNMTSIIIYSSIECVTKQYLKWKTLAKPLNLNIFGMPQYTEASKDYLKQSGCEIMITTLDAINVLFYELGGKGIRDFFESLKYVIHFDVDEQVGKDEGQALSWFHDKVYENASKRIHKIATAPVMTADLCWTVLNSRFMDSGNCISVGTSPEAIIASMDITTYFEDDPEMIDFKINQWLNFQFDEKWVIIRDSNFDYIHKDLKRNHGDRMYDEKLKKSAAILSLTYEELVSNDVRLPGAGIIFIPLTENKSTIIRAFRVVQQPIPNEDRGFVIGFRPRLTDKVKFEESIFQNY